MEKEIRHAISVVIQNNSGKTLFAFRSKDKPSYPSVWSLPSATIRNSESPQDTIKRIGVDKLGVDLKPGSLLIEGKQDRDDYILFMHDYEATLSSGTPRVVSSDYDNIEWKDSITQINQIKPEDMGMCTKLYKQYLLTKN